MFQGGPMGPAYVNLFNGMHECSRMVIISVYAVMEHIQVKNSGP